MTLDADLQLAMHHHRAQRFPEADALYRSILLAQPDHPDANHNFGLLALQLGQTAYGLPFFKAAVALEPERRQFWSSYIEALLINGRNDEAHEICEQGRLHGFELEVPRTNDAALAPELAASEQDGLANEFIATIKTLVERGLHDDAQTLAHQMTELCPQHGFGWKAVAQAALRRGDLAAALEPLERAATLLPGDAETGNHLYAARALRDARELDAQREYTAAGKLYQAVLETYPDHPDANHKLGVIAIRLYQPEAAIPHLEKALGSDPNNHQYWANYIDALLQAGQVKAAWLALEMAQQRGLAGPQIDQLIAIMTRVSTQPTLNVLRPVEASATPAAAPSAREAPAATSAKRAPEKPLTPAQEKEFRAVADAFNSGQIQQAFDGARKLVERFPHHGFGWKVLGVAQHRLGRYDDSLDNVLKALELWPNDLDLLQLAAGLLQIKNKLRDAHERCARLLELQADHAEGLRLMGVIKMGLGQLAEAERFGRLAVEANETGFALNSLGVTLMKQGRLDEAAELMHRGTELDPDNDMMYSNMAFCLTHSENVTPTEVFAAHRRFAARFEAPFKPQWPNHANSKDPARRLRIGFISGDFCHHAVASFVEPMLPPLLRDNSLTLHAYSNTPVDDDVTARMRSLFGRWHHVVGMSDEAVAELIRAEEIDILIDLSGHTAFNRLRSLARKPAPIQASWIGYPGTTGLDAVDYFFADRFWVPSEQFRNQFTEKIAYLPAVAPFQADQLCPPENHLPALRNGFVTFGSFNRLDKLRRDVIALWARVLRAVPDARLAIGAMPADGNGELAAWFAEEGIASERIDYRQRAGVAVYLQQHHHVDICLDSFPFSGLTTALHSLWMGVPTLTLPAHTVPGRSGLTAMSHVGLEQYIATDPDDYVRKAVALASDVPALAALRSGLRERCAQSPMFRPEVVAHSMSRALRIMWQRWCAGLPAESFDVAADRQ